MFEFIVVILLVAIGFVVWMAFLPSVLTIERSRTIAAPAHDVYSALQDLQTWPSWNPWLLQESYAKLTYSEISNESGSWLAWDGQWLGVGQVKHTHLDPPTTLHNQLTFERPKRAPAHIIWHLQAVTGGTEVRVSLKSRLLFLMRWLNTKVSHQLALDFDIGLARLAMQVGDDSDPLALQFSGVVAESVCHYVALRYEGGLQQRPEAMRAGYMRLAQLVEQQGMEPNGTPLTLYHKLNPKTQWVVCDMALPVKHPQAVDDVFVGELPERRYLRTVLTGDYHYLEQAWHAAFSHLRLRCFKRQPEAPLLESYVNDPEVTSAPQRQTYLDIPLQ